METESVSNTSNLSAEDRQAMSDILNGDLKAADLNIPTNLQRGDHVELDGKVYRVTRITSNSIILKALRRSA